MLFAPPQTPEEIAAEQRELRERRERETAERRPIVIGVIGTIVIHLLLVLLFWNSSRFAYRSWMEAAAANEREKANQRELLLNLVSEDEPEKKPFRFVETNPDAPENTPENTENFGARNQQVAQPDPGHDKTEFPKTSGEAKDSTAIVTGSRATPIAAPPPGAGGDDKPDLVASAAGPRVVTKAETPLPGFEKIIGDNPEGIGTNIGENPKDAKAETDRKVDGQKTDKVEPQIAVSGDLLEPGRPGAAGRPGPRPRPKLQQVRPAVLAEQPLSASDKGAIAVNSRLSAAGTWFQEFIETVDAEFQRTAAVITTTPRTRVTVRFLINAKGEIAKILDVQGEDTAGRAEVYACLDSINHPAPYKPWTPDMIAMFSEQEEVTFTFYFY